MSLFRNFKNLAHCERRLKWQNGTTKKARKGNTGMAIKGFSKQALSKYCETQAKKLEAQYGFKPDEGRYQVEDCVSKHMLIAFGRYEAFLMVLRDTEYGYIGG